MKPSFCHLFRRFSVTMAPIAPSKRQNICAKNKVIIIITLMPGLGLKKVTTTVK